jgi:hypothetical protein
VRGWVALFCAGSVAFASAYGSAACGLTADYSGLQDGSAPMTEAGAPPMNEAGAPSTSFCASLTAPVSFCSDFDESEALEAGWGAVDFYGGASMSLSQTAFSRPSSFLSSVNPTGAPSSARLEEGMPTFASHVHVEFEMLLVPSDGTLELGVVHEVTEDGTTYGLYYREVSSTLQVQLRALDQYGNLVQQTWPLGPPVPGWTHVVMDMDVSDNASFTVAQSASDGDGDGGAVVETNQPTSTDSRVAMFVEVGFFSNGPTSGTANFDNVIIDWSGGTGGVAMP